MTTLPTDSADRKNVPLARGVLDYFPAALAEVARLSKEGNDKHNPGEEMHHARGKSSDHADCIMRHLAERGQEDTDGFLHEVKVAWRALALLQESLEERGAPLARGARVAGYTGEWTSDVEPVEDEVPLDSPFYTWIESDSPLDYDVWLRDLSSKAAVLDAQAKYCPNVITERIAGDTGRSIKAMYYGEQPVTSPAQRFTIAGWCGWCDAELPVDGVHFTRYDGVKFCDCKCANTQREWDMSRKIGP